MAIPQLVIADNDNVTISTNAKKVDSEGDLGYIVTITNKTSGKVYAYSDIGWSVKGSDVDDAVLRTVVDSGETVEEFMWFDHRNVGTGSLDDLEDVQGTIVIQDYDSSAIIGKYAFKA